MKLINRILLATDLSVSQDSACRTAIELARTFSSTVDLLHVIEGFFDPPSRRDTQHQCAMDELNKLRDRMMTEGVAVDQMLVNSGEASVCIDEAAQACNANVIVLGGSQPTIGSTGQLGSVAQSVIANSIKPVWVAAPGSTGLTQRILCPIDFSDASRRALQNALYLARRCRADLWVTHVTKRKWWQLDEDAVIFSAQKAQVQFEEFINQFDMTDVTCRTTLACGHPASEILKLAKEVDADLLTMGSMGWSWNAWTIGRVAAEIIQRPPCSLLMVKTEDAVRVETEDVEDESTGAFTHGCELLAVGFLEESIQALDRYLATNPQHAPSWEALAQAHSRLNQQREAERCLRIAEVIRLQDRTSAKHRHRPDVDSQP
jgi:universal stress protein E